MIHRPIHVFSDFDGTIAINDLGDEVFVQFGRFDEVYPRLQSGELNVQQYWRAVCATLEQGLTLERIRLWAAEQPADEHFSAFAAFCATNAIPLTVVSDGFDTYICTVLERETPHNSSNVNNNKGGAIQTFCNQLRETPEGSIEPVFWGADESCGCFCASCKRNAILRSAHPDALIVYIGDGYSDFCAAEHADVIFAKKALAAYCNAQRIPHYPFASFADVLAIMQTLIHKKRLKPRHQADLKRKEAFAVE